MNPHWRDTFANPEWNASRESYFQKDSEVVSNEAASPCGSEATQSDIAESATSEMNAFASLDELATCDGTIDPSPRLYFSVSTGLQNEDRVMWNCYQDVEFCLAPVGSAPSKPWDEVTRNRLREVLEKMEQTVEDFWDVLDKVSVNAVQKVPPYEESLSSLPQNESALFTATENKKRRGEKIMSEEAQFTGKVNDLTSVAVCPKTDQEWETYAHNLAKELNGPAIESMVYSAYLVLNNGFGPYMALQVIRAASEPQLLTSTVRTNSNSSSRLTRFDSLGPNLKRVLARHLRRTDCPAAEEIEYMRSLSQDDFRQLCYNWCNTHQYQQEHRQCINHCSFPDMHTGYVDLSTLSEAGRNRVLTYTVMNKASLQYLHRAQLERMLSRRLLIEFTSEVAKIALERTGLSKQGVVARCIPMGENEDVDLSDIPTVGFGLEKGMTENDGEAQYRSMNALRQVEGVVLVE